MTTRAVLEAELAQVQATIDGAYWRFCRTARALPPVLAVPGAYRRRKEILAELARRRARVRRRA